MFTWGHLDEAEYRRQRAEAEAALASLPDNDKLVLFDRTRAVIRSIPESIAAANPERIQQLLVMIIERVETDNRKVVGVVWRPEVRPFLAESAFGRWRLRTALGARQPRRPTRLIGTRRRTGLLVTAVSEAAG